MLKCDGCEKTYTKTMKNCMFWKDQNLTGWLKPIKRQKLQKAGVL